MRWSLPLLALVIAGCSGDRAATNAVVRDSAGIRIVEHAEPDWTAAPWTIADSPTVSIGSVDGEEPYQLFRVRGATRAPDGRIYILNASTGQVRIFDDVGRFVTAMGGLGRGPGEFRYPAGLLLLPGDSVAVWDMPGGPRVVFAPDGTPARTEILDQAAFSETVGAGRGTEDFRPLENGAFIAAVWVVGQEQDIPDGQLYRPPFELLLIPPDLSDPTSLGTYGGIEQMFVDVGGRRRSSTVLFSPHYQIASGGSPFTIALGNGDRYDIHVRTADGALRTILRRTTPPAPITPVDRDSALASRYAWAEQQGRLPVLERMTAALPEQQHFPAHGSLAFDRAGNLWVQEYGRPTDAFDRWTIYEPDGDLAGWLRSPSDRAFVEIGDDYILALERDENDVERITLYPLRKTPTP
jgi:hypothetical protein